MADGYHYEGWDVVSGPSDIAVVSSQRYCSHHPGAVVRFTQFHHYDQPGQLAIGDPHVALRLVDNH